MSTSVARLMPSISECRVPYLLSNLLFVTESFTLIAGKSRRPSLANSYRRWTPVVVSSVTPLMSAATRLHRCGSASRLRRRRSRMTRYSSPSSSVTAGTAPAFSYSTPLWTSSVTSPPSSRIMLGPVAPSEEGQVSACSVHHQYSGSVSPFHANTGTPWGFSGVPSGPTATAAAAWSCVEKMLQDAHRTCAPRATSVSIRTAVWIVMCSEPVMRAPRSGCDSPYSRRVAIRPGISCSASWISLRPNAARPRSATLKSAPVGTVVVLIGAPGSGEGACRRRGSYGDGGGSRGAQAGGGAQDVGAVGALPGEVGIVAAEMAVCGGLLVDGAVQGELLPE